MKITRVQAAQSRNNLRIAALQVKNEAVSTKAEQLALAKRHIEMLDYLKGEVDLAVFPELSTVGFNEHNQFSFSEIAIGLAEDLSGPVTELFRQAAGRLNLAIGFGLVRSAAGQELNSFVIIEPSGNTVVADKYQEFNDYGDNNMADNYRCFPLKQKRIGVTICDNAIMTHVTDGLSAAGPEIVIVPQLYVSATHFDFNYYAELCKASILSVNFAMPRGGRSTFYDLFYRPESTSPTTILVHPLPEEETEVSLIVTL